jgi:hypothetical protein
MQETRTKSKTDGQFETTAMVRSTSSLHQINQAQHLSYSLLCAEHAAVHLSYGKNFEARIS